MKHLLAISLILVVSTVSAQDVHFSQTEMAPLQINPGLTGAFQGDHRVILNYRDQWKSVAAATPYQTMALSYDGNFMKGKWSWGWIGGGLYLNRDVAGPAQLGTTQVSGSLSGIIKVTESQRITAGFMGGAFMHSVDLNSSDLKWGSQFNGQSYDPNLPSNEAAYSSSQTNMSFSTGATWSYGLDESNIVSNDNFVTTLGVGFHHFNKPNAVYSELQETGSFSRMSVHGGASIGILNSNWTVLPSFVFFKQGPQKEINAATLVKYRLQEESRHTGFLKESSFYMGAHYRFKDAIIPTIALEYANYYIGISYDVNVSGLKTASNGKGGFEIALKFITPVTRGSNRKGQHKTTRFL